jgi:ElaB/YqjD/DUF883 family membrane-anchored ribosome-binding protein
MSRSGNFGGSAAFSEREMETDIPCERSTEMAQSTNGAATSEDLARQIEALKNDVASISRILADMGAQRRDDLKDSVNRTAADLRAKGEATVNDARDRGLELGEQAADAVRRQPATAIGLAVGVGFLIGFMTGRR